MPAPTAVGMTTHDIEAANTIVRITTTDLQPGHRFLLFDRLDDPGEKFDILNRLEEPGAYAVVRGAGQTVARSWPKYQVVVLLPPEEGICRAQ